MNLLTVYNTYQEASQTVSDLVRQMAYAGIAVVWILKDLQTPAQTPQLSAPSFSLLLALAFLVFTIAFDLFQYLCKYFVYQRLFRAEEKKLEPNTKECEYPQHEVSNPPCRNIFTYVFFRCKILSVMIAYVFIFIHAIKTWHLL